VTIDALIGGSYEVFVRTVVRGQNDPWNFAQSTDARKREILDAISGAESLRIHEARAKALRAEAGQKLDVYEAQIRSLTQQLERIDVTGLQTSAEQWQGEHEARIASARADVAALESVLGAAVAQDADRELTALKRAEIRSQKPALDMTPYADAENGARMAWARADASHKGAREVWEQVAELTPGSKCPTCRKEILATDPIAETVQELAQIASNAEKAAMEARTYLEGCTSASEGAARWLAGEIGDWQAKLDAIPDPGDAKAPAAERAVEQARTLLTTVLDATNPFVEAIAQQERQRGDLLRQVAVLGEAARLARTDRELAEAWQEATGPKGARASLGEAALLAIEEGANRWLSVLSPNGMTVEFPPTRETATSVKEEIQTVVRVRGPSGEVERSLQAFSGGEKKRINFAVDLGVADAFAAGGALAVSLLVLDEEVFSGLDEPGKRAMATALTYAGVADVVCIDHDPRLSATLPRSITVSRGSDGYTEVT